MNTTFHLSIGIKALEESVKFFVDLLGGKILHRDESGYMNVNLSGCEITLKENPTIKPDLADFHFGINLDLAEFDRLAEKISVSGYKGVISKPEIIDPGTPIERKKMYLKCPTGYIVEIKGYQQASGR